VPSTLPTGDVRLSDLIEYCIERKTGTVWKTKGSIGPNVSTLRTFAKVVREIAKVDPEISEIEDRLIMAAVEKQWPKTGQTHTYRAQNGRVKAFFNWAIKKGYTFGDIEAFLANKPKRPEVEKILATREDVEKAKAVLIPRGDFRRARAIEFHFESHRRPGEIPPIRVRDVDLRPQSDAEFGVYWYTEEKSGQGRKRKELQENEANVLRQWLKEYAEAMGVKECYPEWFLFPATRSAGGVKGGGSSGVKMFPDEMIGDHVYFFTEIWKDAGVYRPRMGGHANRRGGMTEAYEMLVEAGYSDPIEIIIERSDQTPATARDYIGVRTLRTRSVAAYKAIRRGLPREETPQVQEAETDSSEVQAPVTDNIIQFGELQRRRRIG
jgi:hypothetical protein